MATQWGRRERIFWQPHVPVFSYLAAGIVLFSALFFLWEDYAFQQPALRRAYTIEYLRASVGEQFNMHGKYRLILLGGSGRPERLGSPDDFMQGRTILPDGNSVNTMLSDEARRQGFTFFHRGPVQTYSDKSMARWLRGAIFDGRSLIGAYTLVGWETLPVLLLALYWAVPRDMRRLRELKYGRRLKGPVMLDAKAFNREVRGDGVGITTADQKTILRIPTSNEPQHIAVIGDTGTGKSTLITQLLQQVGQRGESAIVYDPACEFVKRFYDPKRGDVILNPLDARCPYWGPAEELRRKAEAKTIAASLYQPTSDRKGEFFTETPQKIFAHLLTFGPTPQQLVEWMSNPDEVDERVQGTELEQIVAKGAQQQRAGVLASLGLIADSLRMLPTRTQTGGRTWSATQWAEKREGWIFITSQATEREALRPLHSLWIDLLVLRLLNAPTPEQRPVWFVLDELASLQRLPQLHTAITENRKSKNPLILGFQGKAQLETIYGHFAEVMLSQPATKIFLRTTEPNASKWVSDAIGEVEIERMRETHQHGTRHGKSFTIDRQTEPLVMRSEISGLPDKHAFLKLGNNVARFNFSYTDLPTPAVAFEPRQVEDDELSFDPVTLRPRQAAAGDSSVLPHAQALVKDSVATPTTAPESVSAPVPTQTVETSAPEHSSPELPATGGNEDSASAQRMAAEPAAPVSQPSAPAGLDAMPHSSTEQEAAGDSAHPPAAQIDAAAEIPPQVKGTEGPESAVATSLPLFSELPAAVLDIPTQPYHRPAEL